MLAAFLGDSALQDGGKRLPRRQREEQCENGKEEQNPLRPAPILATNGK